MKTRPSEIRSEYLLLRIVSVVVCIHVGLGGRCFFSQAPTLLAHGCLDHRVWISCQFCSTLLHLLQSLCIFAYGLSRPRQFDVDLAPVIVRRYTESRLQLLDMSLELL